MAAAYWKPVRGLCRNGRCHHNCIDWWPASFPNGTESDRAQTVCWSCTSAWLWAHFPVCSANRLNPKISKLYFKGVGEALMKHLKTFTSSLKWSNDLWCLLSSVSSVTSNKDAHHGHKTWIITSPDAFVDKWYTDMHSYFIFALLLADAFKQSDLPMRI